MKFGKRLGAEAARRWKPFYLDYKIVKKAIADDVAEKDDEGSSFSDAIGAELFKISAFHAEKEEELEAMLKSLKASPSEGVGSLRMEIADLRKFAVLNYIAVIKSAKKRNRHLAAACAPVAVRPVKAVELLSQQYFFTSPRLAALATEAEILQQKQHDEGGLPGLATLDEYQCPICFETLHSPVVLTCAHRFCWGCLVAHCAMAASAAGGGAARPSGDSAPDDKAGAEGGKAQYATRLVAQAAGDSAVATYDCPVCRRAQILDLDRLQVDPHLTAFIEELKLRDGARGESMNAPPPPPPEPAAPPEADEAEAADGPVPHPTLNRGVLHNQLPSALPLPRTSADVASDDGEAPLLPPQLARHQGKLTVVLDMDGTLISSFTPARAPRLPGGMITYVVGRGARINPKGVFVVERPGLKEFFAQLCEFAEIILFTAGVEDYAVPIAERLQQRYSCFDGRLYRPATQGCPLYPCIKDLARLGRPLARTVLVDDTPLAFCRQPDNGIPVFNFRGDGDDRLLGEAVLPLLQSLAAAEDVRPVLRARFNMPHWFKVQGVSLAETRPAALPRTPPPGGKAARPVKRAAVQPFAARSLPAGSAAQTAQRSRSLLLTDFDKTLTDCDAGERLVGALAPELAPMLAAMEMPANFVPTTNSVLAEMQRRGIGRDTVLGELRAMGSEIPAASIALMQWARKQGVEVRILSDCNAVFISHMLSGARASTLPSQIVTNHAEFVRVKGSQEGDDPAAMLQAVGAQEAAAHRLVVTPHTAPSSPHGCPLCPANLCKGREVVKLRQGGPWRRIVYCGDGANDLCPALTLTEGDLLCARRGTALDKLVQQRAEEAAKGVPAPQGSPGGQTVVAGIHMWDTHAELLSTVQRLLT